MGYFWGQDNDIIEIVKLDRTGLDPKITQIYPVSPTYFTGHVTCTVCLPKFSNCPVRPTPKKQNCRVRTIFCKLSC